MKTLLTVVGKIVDIKTASRIVSRVRTWNRHGNFYLYRTPHPVLAFSRTFGSIPWSWVRWQRLATLFLR